jgi:hypothetical protein
LEKSSMTLTAVAFFSQLLLVLFPGLVLHHALAIRVLRLDIGDPAFKLTEVDLLVFGLLPGLALANTVGTLLAVVHLFYWWAYLAVVVIVVGWRWRDAVATLAAVGMVVRESFRSLLRGNLMVVIAYAIFLQTLAGILVEAQIPSGNVDVWNHNFPLAKSIVAHHGFVMPQIDNMFYGSYPIFFHMFFAEGLLFVDNVIAAKAANAMLYLGFLLSLLGVARNGRAVVAVAVSIFVISTPFFSSGAADAMTDIGRVCFTALAFVFAYQYFRAGRLYFLFASGLLAGGAIAGKYTELLTPLLIGASLLPALIGRRQGSWLAVVVFSVASVVTGAYPYLRNLVLLHNPIYPFFFGHPGLSDDYMRGLQVEIFKSLDPEFRAYSHNLFSFQGWRDFASAAQEVFFSHWHLTGWVFAIIAIGLIVLHSRSLLCFALWTFAMWIFWDTLGYMNGRWGLPAFMLLSVMPVLVIGALIDRGAERLAMHGNSWGPPVWRGAEPLLGVIPGWLTPMSVIRIAVAVWALFICVGAIQRVRADGLAGVFPRWMNGALAHSVLQPGGFDNYLSRSLEGYKIYRYIGDHDLRVVLQPFDNGADFYQAAFNDGKNGHWMFPYYTLPKDTSGFDSFIRNNNIRYFVYRKSLPPLNAERLGEGSGNPRHAEIAYELMGYLLPSSRLLLTDHFGWELREIGPDKLQ